MRHDSKKTQVMKICIFSHESLWSGCACLLLFFCHFHMKDCVGWSGSQHSDWREQQIRLVPLRSQVLGGGGEDEWLRFLFWLIPPCMRLGWGTWRLYEELIVFLHCSPTLAWITTIQLFGYINKVVVEVKNFSTSLTADGMVTSGQCKTTTSPHSRTSLFFCGLIPDSAATHFPKRLVLQSIDLGISGGESPWTHAMTHRRVKLREVEIHEWFTGHAQGFQPLFPLYSILFYSSFPTVRKGHCW